MKHWLHEMPKLHGVEFVPFWVGQQWAAGERTFEAVTVVGGSQDGSALLQAPLPAGHLPVGVDSKSITPPS